MKKMILGGIAAIAVLAITMGTVSATASVSDYEVALSAGRMECRWQQLNGYEGCLNGGDGNTCTCGSTTRPIPPTSPSDSDIFAAY
ncbi:MAG: hypothetical protein LBD80_09110 [Tannerella sp.]|jgi:uncharacterized membrane protein|nr:hypothetical protein [Tannerella sp.]